MSPEMEHIPLEIVIIIFSKATLMTLLQCRRVCKPWLAALSDPAILRPHIKLPKCLLLYRNPNDCSPAANSRFLYLYDHRDVPSQHNAVVRLAAKASQGTTELVGHCNGLLCWHRRGTIYVSNPLTGESMTIPTGQRSLSRIGFGFIPNRNQYKLVHLVGELEANVQILGSGTRKCLKCPYNIRSKSGVHLNGALHWLDTDNNICFLDLETDRFGTLPSPPVASTHPVRGMAVIKDWCANRVYGQTWMMMEYGVGGSWTELRERWFSGELRFERLLIFYRNNKSLLLRRYRERGTYYARKLFVYEHMKGEYTFVALPFGNIDEAVPGFVPTFIPMEVLFKGS